MSGNAPKILIVVLVALVVFFVVGLGLGANNGLGGFSLDSVISSVSGLLPIPAVSLDDLDASPSTCLDRSVQRIIVPNPGGCILTIAASSANIRALKLQIASGSSVHLELSSDPVQAKPMTVTTDLPKGGSDHTTLNLFPSGGRLTISQCAPGSVCVLNILS